MLKSVKIKNFGPIEEGEIDLSAFTFLVGRNNAGKSHYLKAIELLLTSTNPKQALIPSFRDGKTIEIEGTFSDAASHLTHITANNQRQAVEQHVVDDTLTLRREYTLTGTDVTDSKLKVLDATGEMVSPTGWTSILKSAFPECIVIDETHDAEDEMKSTKGAAISRLKSEVLRNVFTSVDEKFGSITDDLNAYLNADDDETRAVELKAVEEQLDSELSAEFSGVTSRIKFPMPEVSEVVSDVEFLLDDGVQTPVGNKGYGLQRNFVLALLSVLAKNATEDADAPHPIFLIGELETFLHPVAQKRFARTLSELSDTYQVITTTHSPFSVLPERISGYRRVVKTDQGSRCFSPSLTEDDLEEITSQLERRSNLEGLFADRVVLVEGKHDDRFFSRIREALGLSDDGNEGRSFVQLDGRTGARKSIDFYTGLAFDDLVVVFDLDFIYSQDIHRFYESFEADDGPLQELWDGLGWGPKRIDGNFVGDKKLSAIVDAIEDQGEPSSTESVIAFLESKNIYVLRRGAPEHYYANNLGEKDGWRHLGTRHDVVDPEYWEMLLTRI